MPDPVRRVALPARSRRRSTLAAVDYEDAFIVETGPTGGRSAEGWVREILAGAPAAVRSSLVSGWTALGLRIGSPRDAQLVLGWEVRRSTPDTVLLGADSRIGLPAELLLERRERSLLFATLVRQENPVARALWAGVIPLHQQVVRRVLARVAGAPEPVGPSVHA